MDHVFAAPLRQATLPYGLHTRAVEACDLRFEHVENVLKRGIEASPHVDGRNVPITPVQNVRGAGYYDNKDH